jgi:hypothetical protein
VSKRVHPSWAFASTLVISETLGDLFNLIGVEMGLYCRCVVTHTSI